MIADSSFSHALQRQILQNSPDIFAFSCFSTYFVAGQCHRQPHAFRHIHMGTYYRARRITYYVAFFFDASSAKARASLISIRRERLVGFFLTAGRGRPPRRCRLGAQHAAPVTNCHAVIAYCRRVQASLHVGLLPPQENSAIFAVSPHYSSIIGLKA